MREFSDAEWEALKVRAREIGTEHGANAAEWVTQNMTDATARWWVKGIDDGDPEVLDRLPDRPLSGEWADSYGQADLYRELGVAAGDDSDDVELCREYEDGYNTAVQTGVESRARHQLA